MPEMNYGMVDTGSQPGGGIFQTPEGVPPYSTFYVQVEDIDAKLKEAESLGAKIMVPKTQISENYGYFGLFSDPDGNVVGLWSHS